MAPLQPLLLELPLLLTCWGFSAALMGLSGSHIHQFMSIRDKIANQSPTLPGFIELDTHGIEKVDLAMLIIGSISFAFIGVFLFLSCGQFKGQRGEYSGKGTGAWLFVGLVLLVLSGAWTGVVSALTAWTVKYSYTFTRGPNYSEPFSTEQRLYLDKVDYFVRQQFSSGLNLANMPRIDPSFLGVWGSISTIDQANAYLESSNYLQLVKTYKAQVAVGWVTLGTVFFTMVVHFALPFAWQRFGLTRQPKKNSYNEV